MIDGVSFISVILGALVADRIMARYYTGSWRGKLSDMGD